MNSGLGASQYVLKSSLVYCFGPAIIFIGDPQVDPLYLFAYRLARDQEETSTSRVGRRRGPS